MSFEAAIAGEVPDVGGGLQMNQGRMSRLTRPAKRNLAVQRRTGCLTEQGGGNVRDQGGGGRRGAVACSQTVRLVRIVLDYRVRCKKIELRREQLRLNPGSQSAQAQLRRHTCSERRPSRSSPRRDRDACSWRAP